MSQLTQDGQKKNESHVLSNILARKSKKPMFLQNVGLEHAPTRYNMKTLTALLESERRGNADLHVIVDSQTETMAELTRKVKDGKVGQAALEAKLDSYDLDVQE